MVDQWSPPPDRTYSKSPLPILPEIWVPPTRIINVGEDREKHAKQIELRLYIYSNTTINERKIKSIFPEQKDHKQFILNLNSIEASAMINNLNIPSCINQQIAEYSVGDVSNCINEECKNKIIMLDEDKNSEYDTYHHPSYGYNGYRDYHCSECIKNTNYKQCECGGWGLIESIGRCDLCKVEIKRCCVECDHCYGLLSCFECSKCVCYGCRVECTFCHEEICLDCYDQALTGKYVIRQCEHCGNCLPKTHENCYGDYDCSDDYDFYPCWRYEEYCYSVVCGKCDKNETSQCINCGEKGYVCNDHKAEHSKNYMCYSCKNNIPKLPIYLN